MGSYAQIICYAQLYRRMYWGKGCETIAAIVQTFEPAIDSWLSGHGRVVWTDCQAGPLSRFFQEVNRRRSPGPAWARKSGLTAAMSSSLAAVSSAKSRRDGSGGRSTVPVKRSLNGPELSARRG